MKRSSLSFYCCLVILHLAIVILFFSQMPGLAAEKLKFGTVLKRIPNYDLLGWAADEKGLWKGQGLEAEWIPFERPPDFYRALAAEILEIGVSLIMGPIELASRGGRVIILGELPQDVGFELWVPKDSLIREPKDLKGKKIGSVGLVGVSYAMSRFLVKSAGYTEKDVKIVGLGGFPTQLAALKAGHIDAFPQSFGTVANLVIEGELRRLLSISEYLPREWIEETIIGTKKFVRERPEVAKRAVAALVQANDFVSLNHPWATGKLRANYGHSEAAAKAVVEKVFSKPGETGRITGKAMENVVNFMIEWSLVPKDKVPPLEELYTNKFLPGNAK